MNVRKPIDYPAMHRELNALLSAELPQMNLYCEIGRLVSTRQEKGVAVAAAEYLGKTYPDISGFSPRNLRRMRDFYKSYKDTPEVLAEAMTIGWTQNIVILENYKTLEERTWYIDAVRQFNWSKAELLKRIADGAHKNGALVPCFNEATENRISSSEEAPSSKIMPRPSSQSDFFRLNPQKMIFWSKQSPQNERKGGMDHEPESNQHPCHDRLCPAGLVARYPSLAEMRLLPGIGRFPALCRMRPGLPPLWPPADRQDNASPPSGVGYAAQDNKKGGSYQSSTK